MCVGAVASGSQAAAPGTVCAENAGHTAAFLATPLVLGCAATPTPSLGATPSAAPPGRNGSSFQGLLRVGHDQVGVENEFGAEAVALGTRTMRAVETEMRRREIPEADAALDAGIERRVQRVGPRIPVGWRGRQESGWPRRRVKNPHHIVAPLQCCLDRIGRSHTDLVGTAELCAWNHKPVHHGFDGVLVVLLQPD